MATAEDICIGRFPPIIVNARGQLRDVIRRTIALDAGDFAKIVDGVTCLAGASTDPYKKKSPRGFSRLSQDFNDVINPNRVNPQPLSVEPPQGIEACIQSRSLCPRLGVESLGWSSLRWDHP